MPENTHLRIAMFMAIGASNALLWSRLHPDNSHLFDRFGGQTGVMDEVANHVERLVRAYESHDVHPGVFEYEVAEPSGGSIIDALLRHGDNTESALTAIHARLDSHIRAFFAKAEERDSSVAAASA